MEEARVGLGDELDRREAIGNRSRLQHYPQVARALGEGMVADAGAARYLVVDEQIARVHFLNQLVQQVLQLLLGAGHLDFQQLCAVEETVDMLVDGEDLVVARRAGIVDAVAEPVDAVVHRDGHFIERTEFAVVVTEVFHG